MRVGRRAERLLALVALLLLPMAAQGQQRLELWVPPELDLSGTERVYVGPILLEPREDASFRRVDASAVRELDRHIRKLIRRETRLNLLPPADNLSLPAGSLLELDPQTDFWRTLGGETGADYIVAASIDVEVLDRAGYQTEKYVSPEDGKTYFRQVLVEETGFSHDILLAVYDGRTGAKVLEEQISDFKEKPVRQLDQFEDMFRDLYNLDTRLLGIFVPRTVQAKRYLFK